MARRHNITFIIYVSKILIFGDSDQDLQCCRIEDQQKTDELVKAKTA